MRALRDPVGWAGLIDWPSKRTAAQSSSEGEPESFTCNPEILRLRIRTCGSAVVYHGSASSTAHSDVRGDDERFATLGLLDAPKAFAELL
jgi:hypothetical protein